MNVGSVQDFQVFPNEVYTEQGFVLCFVFPSLPVLLESVLYFVSKQPNQNLDRQGESISVLSTLKSVILRHHSSHREHLSPPHCLPPATLSDIHLVLDVKIS